MAWPTYVPPRQEEDLEEHQEDSVDVGEYRIEITSISELGPTIEVKSLFRRLYGEPQECDTPNPYVAEYRRLRVTALQHSKGSQGRNYIVGRIDYRYWPSLKLGYIENAHVSSAKRRKGVGVTLMHFVINYMRRQGSDMIYAFSVNTEGFGLLVNAGFIAQPPEDPEYPWRSWFSIT